MNKHTPGPWEIGAEYMVCKLDELVVGSNHIQAKNNRESEEADARLIAAAPRMKKALERIHELRFKDLHAEYLLESIGVEAVIALQEAKGEQG